MMTQGTTRAAASWAAAIKKLGYLKGNSRLVLVWPLAALFLGVLGWYLLLSGLNADKAELEKRVLKEAEVLAQSYADQLTRTVEAIDQIALHVRYDWELSKGKLQLDDAKAKGLFPPSSIFLVAIIDESNRYITGTLPVPKYTFVGDSEDLLAQNNATRDFLYIGKPTIGRVSKRITIPFTRRLVNQEGRFAGVVVVSVAPHYFTGTYNVSTFGQSGFLGIVGEDNVVRATRIGQTVQSLNPSALLSVPRFSSSSKSTLLNGNEWFADKRSRYVGWAPVVGYPLTAVAGLDQQEILAPYEASHQAAIRNGIIATVALAVFALIATALSLRLAWRKSQHESSQASYRLATEGGIEGFYIVRRVATNNDTLDNFQISDCNHHGAALFHYRREELLGKTVSTLYEGAKPERVLQMLRHAMDSGSYEGEWEVPSDSPFAARWVHLKAVRSGETLAITLRDISDTKAHVAELERRSNEDFLTGLPNRHWVQAYLPKAIGHASANNALLAVLFIDLDGFKTVNDTLGHEAGDEVLRNAARRLKESVRPHDYVARLGGDEFVVVLEGIEQTQDAAHLADRVQHAFKDSFRLAQGVGTIGVSIGVSIFPRDGMDAETLLRNADIAMYAVKTSGKRNYRFYDEKLYDALRMRLQQEAELREAIEKDQFVMYYQPRVELSSGRPSSMEALIRWEHPLKGLLSPLEFIPLAEETGLILPLGELVVDKVCAQLAYWSHRGEPLPVSMNVSARQFNEVDVAQIMAAVLERHGTRPELIEIEVTESSMMVDSPHISGALQAIRRMGVKLLVDDFGTGYSSLSQLQRLDFDVLKVDRAFTAELGRTERGNVFFKAIITMAHALGMRVVAEGVENLEQIEILKSLHCDEIQGFYISKPLPPSETQPMPTKRLTASSD